MIDTCILHDDYEDFAEKYLGIDYDDYVTFQLGLPDEDELEIECPLIAWFQWNGFANGLEMSDR